MRKVLLISALVALMAFAAGPAAWADSHTGDQMMQDDQMMMQYGDQMMMQYGDQMQYGGQAQYGTGAQATTQLAETGGPPLVPLAGGAAAILLLVGGALLTARHLRQR
jgi:hypothetical protein